MSTSWMLVDKLSQVKLLAMDDPVVWVDFVGGAKIVATKSETLISRIIASAVAL